ncbi:MAG: LytTR family DNA-binding domain-containing protein [Bacteroidetes bacterium]|nr:LytTR family DNA-binding domain-containing protein [Bacteroidota bacterium]
MKSHTFVKDTGLDMLRTIIIDDEALVRDTLSKLLHACCPNVKIIGLADGVESGIATIRKHHPDLVLLDIKMDDGTGFDLLKAMEPVNFKVIFITAYEQFAVKAFKFSALDYLLKPIDPEELTEAVNRAEQVRQQEFHTQLNTLEENLASQSNKNRKIILKTSDNIYLIRVQDISYIESDGSYAFVYLHNGNRILVSRNLKEFEELLIDHGFYRVHKSFLINLTHIARFEKGEGGYLILDNESKVPVASRKREELLEMFSRLSE